jgi:hypothetical protein
VPPRITTATPTPSVVGASHQHHLEAGAAGTPTRPGAGEGRSSGFAAEARERFKPRCPTIRAFWGCKAAPEHAIAVQHLPSGWT